MNLLKKCVLFFLLTVAVPDGWANLSTGTSVSSFDVYSCGFSTASSSSYRNFGLVGQAACGASASASYKNYAGFVPAFVLILDVVISFIDESPSSGEWQQTTNVTCHITVETLEGNPVSGVKYRIASEGADEAVFSPWRSDAVIETTYSGSEVRFQAAIPGAALDSFAEGQDNFIQWRAKNSGGVEAFSGKYRVRVMANDAPEIAILQPDEKSGVASDRLFVEAQLTDACWGIDENSVELKLDDANNSNIALVTSAANPGIYSAPSGKVSYTYAGAPLAPGATYKLTVSATDKNGKNSSSVLSFKLLGGAIPDIVPYPSPFDPKKESVAIRYVLRKDSGVSINVYDMSGRLVKEVIDNEPRKAGTCEDTWTGRNYAGEGLANGVYFCEVVATDDEGEHRRYSSLAIFGK